MLIWRAAWAYPVVPRPRSNGFEPAYYQFPGRILPPPELSDALARGVPEKQAKFTQEWGGAGPAAFDTAAGLFDEPFDHAQRYWFVKTPDSTRIDDGLPEIDQALDRFTERLRTSLTLAATVASSRTLTLQRRTNEQTAQFQTAITALGSLVLVPTLVVGLFGANVPLPLGNSWLGFGLMVWLTVISAAFVRRWLKSLLRSMDSQSSPQSPS